MESIGVYTLQCFFYREIVKNTKNMESNFRNIKTNE